MGEQRKGELAAANGTFIPCRFDKLIPEAIFNRVLTIAYGSDVDYSDLAKISSATGGQGYSGSPENIRQAYYDISQFF